MNWISFLDFLSERPQNISEDFIIIVAFTRFYLLPQNLGSPKNATSPSLQPSFSTPPTHPGHTPHFLLQLANLCGHGTQSALSLAWPLTLSPGLSDLKMWLKEHSKKLQIPLLATTLPLYLHKEDQDLCDTLSSIRHLRPIKDLGFLRQANGERRLLSTAERDFFSLLDTDLPFDPFERSIELSKRHSFCMSELRYRYPKERLPAGKKSCEYLRELCLKGAQEKYQDGGPPQSTLTQLQKELDLIKHLEFEDYFLTIFDVLSYAREKNILFQGRGSAANSVVCFVLGVTSVDPVQMDLLFERFMSMERKEPPDIDVDFEHERREEVMQEIYNRYGREHAAMVSTTVCFRKRMALRECGKALGLCKEFLDELISYVGRDSSQRLYTQPLEDHLKSLLIKYQVSATTWRRLLVLSKKILHIPRHMGIHTAGFILSAEKLSEECLITPATMKDRTVIPWDKDDVDTLKWMKVDLLSLGMLTAIRKTFDLIENRNVLNKPLTLANLPRECPLVYQAMQRADTVGVFQIESRAQMNMLPRLAPKNFYDIVIEVAIVRPGPLQGGMVHPYLKRRQGTEPITYDHPKLEPILKKTLGVSIFQEQVMKMAVAVGGFSPGEADQMRKVMSGAWRTKTKMHLLKEKLVRGFKENGLKDEVIERVYKQIEGFGEYGFPESHAASFAWLTYVSQWLKVHHPAEFLCALLNSQPMGFYSAQSLIADAKRHGVQVKPVNILKSKSHSTLDFISSPPTVQLGLGFIQSLNKAQQKLIEDLQEVGILSEEHEDAPSLRSLRHRGLSHHSLELLTKAGALKNLWIRSVQAPVATTTPVATIATPAQSLQRQQLWDLWSLKKQNLKNEHLFEENALPGSANFLEKIPAPSEWEQIISDFKNTGLSIDAHPGQYVREKLLEDTSSHPHWSRACDLFYRHPHQLVNVVGLMSVKQRPPTAKGFSFLTLEDESGFINLVLMPEIYEKYRTVIQSHVLLAACGRVQKSFNYSPNDPLKCSVSIMAEKLWAPLEAAKNPDKLPDKKLNYPQRDWG